LEVLRAVYHGQLQALINVDERVATFYTKGKNHRQTTQIKDGN